MCWLRYYLAQPGHVHEHYHMSLVEHALGREAARDPEGYLRRNSVQVPDARHLAHLLLPVHPCSLRVHASVMQYNLHVSRPSKLCHCLCIPVAID